MKTKQKLKLKKEYPSAQLRWNAMKCSAIMYKKMPMRKIAISRLIAWLRCHI